MAEEETINCYNTVIVDGEKVVIGPPPMTKSEAEQLGRDMTNKIEQIRGALEQTKEARHIKPTCVFIAERDAMELHGRIKPYTVEEIEEMAESGLHIV